jgi:hypothetical protein
MKRGLVVILKDSRLNHCILMTMVNNSVSPNDAPSK